jgi:ABC-type phosphate/phosphonate transport system permease subunit
MTENCTSKKEKKTFAKLVIYLVHQLPVMVWFMVFNATFNNISVIAWWLVLLVEETGVPRENHRPVTSH